MLECLRRRSLAARSLGEMVYVAEGARASARAPSATFWVGEQRKQRNPEQSGLNGSLRPDTILGHLAASDPAGAEAGAISVEALRLDAVKTGPRTEMSNL